MPAAKKPNIFIEMGDTKVTVADIFEEAKKANPKVKDWYLNTSEKKMYGVDGDNTLQVDFTE